ncbi:MAG: hypothetical protein D3910_18790 [Candidatus Electrothrix sp. ATG2]|nr:hypothetical protein [Candidatus Electrothrix sp. ATG2]
MGLSALFKELINEHGSAPILKERVAAFKDKVVDLENENSSLKTKISVLEDEIQDLKSEKLCIEEEKSSCQAQLAEIHSVTLSEKHEKVLIAVASYSGHHSAVLAHAAGLSEQETVSKLNYLSSLEMLHFKTGGLADPSNPKSFPKAVSIWFVSGPGHAYIKSHDLNKKIA